MPPDTPTKTGASLGSLPSEVLIKIAQGCRDKYNPSTLHSLCLVSKYMDSVARQELYHGVSIATSRSLRHLCRTLKEAPALGHYIVELKLLFPAAKSVTSNHGPSPTEMDPEKLCERYLDVLKRSPKLRNLEIVLWDVLRKTRVNLGIITPIFIPRLSEVIMQSQGNGPMTAVLSRLQQIRLTTDNDSYRVSGRRSRLTIPPFFFEPFLLLPSLSSIETFKDTGSWTEYHPPTAQMVLSHLHRDGGCGLHPHHYLQIKSVILRESVCTPPDIMGMLDIFPAVETLFIQNEHRAPAQSRDAGHRSHMTQIMMRQRGKLHLSDSLEKMQKLKKLVWISLNGEFQFPYIMDDFLGPAHFLQLSRLANLTSISVPINLFASPDGGETGAPWMLSPTNVLPAYLKSLHIIVDRPSCCSVTVSRPNGVWLDPRESALQFLGELASTCSTTFPPLRQVQYIWAVDRTSHAKNAPAVPEEPAGDPDSEPWRCDGSVPLCCVMHTTIQALSPDEDLESRMKEVVSPLVQRFADLEALFKEAYVAFKVVELKDYRDYFHHWQATQE